MSGRKRDPSEARELGHVATALLWSWILLFQAACEAGVLPEGVVRDSAGIHLTISADEPKDFAQLDSVPAMSIGGPDAAGPKQFFRVQGVHLDRSGRVWVADGQSGELRIFQEDGTHWKTLGGRGEGPGEFLQIRLLGASAGDSVFCGDGGADRITVFDPEGDFVRTERLPSSDRPGPRPFGVFEDGSVLGQLPRVLPAQSLEPGQILRDSVQLVRVTLDPEGFVPYGSAPGPLWLWTGRNQVPVPFTTNASFDVVANDVHLVAGPEFRVRIHNGEGLPAIYGVERHPRVVAASDLDSYRGFVQEYVPESMRADYLEALDSGNRPTRLPGYDRVVASSDGSVWAQVYESDLAAPHDWDVFDREGRYRGRVHVWSGFFPFVITGDAMAGVWRDSVGVESVRVYPLHQ